MRLTRFAIYIGIGALCHAFFVGPVFDWSSAWTLAWLLVWPLMLIAKFAGFVLEFIVICFAAGCVLILMMALGQAISEHPAKIEQIRRGRKRGGAKRDEA